MALRKNHVVRPSIIAIVVVTIVTIQWKPIAVIQEADANERNNQ